MQIKNAVTSKIFRTFDFSKAKGFSEPQVSSNFTFVVNQDTSDKICVNCQTVVYVTINMYLCN